ncbi:PfkB family carbohydrate kinase [Candidatus Dojkabacteria bacterium]|jgi:D-beta-D-heptose 7-phosphate kinase/D-beta-D-heptose 1-phosphate adenosyltransferase|nr:PfkB family carbohydrate kinase [Candidatus Dojkabacteria bacterium]
MKKVLVIGDSCIDIFEYGDCKRLCPEAPVPIFKSKCVTRNGGMSINVIENMKALGVDCNIITNDIRPVKTRYVDEVSNQMLLRIDNNDDILENAIERLKNVDFSKYDAVVISDYNKGYVSREDIKFISENHDLVFLDSKKNLDSWCNGIEFIKLNEKEYQYNERYLTQEFPNNLVVTYGSDGASYENKRIHIKPEKKVEVRDLSGAGDTFLAAFVADYLKNNDICAAIHFANKCASWVVTQKGVAVVDLSKI